MVFSWKSLYSNILRKIPVYVESWTTRGQTLHIAIQAKGRVNSDTVQEKCFFFFHTSLKVPKLEIFVAESLNNPSLYG